ncbi:hypothetical protein POSPLADRAFT_1046455 [Postia placenta MAD-698-R-SB12]|uniref:Uncharacterized protein n=1 Tax=Postia placenta MAD-698-R-SB12 TaxID=670580 RepID=A0A1X6N012_9APHY|nr:hypothetical protein POSPLADRAFT_1046455 [Postia placenta MAD-698-R-SB12]OSX61961.1 hypothetical protein POSPLADRAFT_1046455 [Postia placenta MAD-698-R-SB12]
MEAPYSTVANGPPMSMQSSRPGIESVQSAHDYDKGHTGGRSWEISEYLPPSVLDMSAVQHD